MAQGFQASMKVYAGLHERHHNWEFENVYALLLASPMTFDGSQTTVAQVLSTSSEIAVAGYARKQITNKTKSVDGKGIITLDCDDIDFGALQSGESVHGWLLYSSVTNDNDSVPLIACNGKTECKVAAPASASVPAKAITGITQANPAVVTCVGHGLQTGDSVYIEGLSGGMTQLNGRQLTITVLTSDTFSLNGEDASAAQPYSTGGTWHHVIRVYVRKLEDSIKVGEVITFSGGTNPTGTVVGGDPHWIDLYDLSDALSVSQGGAAVATQQGLPLALANGNLTVAFSASGVVKIGNDY